MKLVEKTKYETVRTFAERIIDTLKNYSEVKIYKTELPYLLSYIELRKICTLHFLISYSTSNEFVILYAAIVGACQKPDTVQLGLKFSPFVLPCYTVGCTHNKYINNKYTCTKEFKYKVCTLKTSNLIKSDL